MGQTKLGRYCKQKIGWLIPEQMDRDWETQEFGGVKNKTAKHGPGIPTPYAAGEGTKKGPRQTTVERKNRMSRLRVQKTPKRVRSIADVRANARRKNSVMFMELNDKKGLFKVTNNKKTGRLDIKMLYNMTKSTINVPKNPWLKPAVDDTIALMPGIYRDNLTKQLRKARTFRR